MNDLFYEIIMQSSVLITGLDKHNLLYNLFLTIFGLFEMPELHIFDLAGQSSKYGRFSPAVYAPSDILDTLTQVHGKMCVRIDGAAHDTAKPIYLYIHNFDSIINQFSCKEKKSVQYIISDMVNRGQAANLHIIITADKCTNSLFSDFKSRVYAGKTDRKTAQKYFGAVARELTNFDCSDSGQAMSIIDGTIYKFNVPEIPESAIDDIIIMHILESSSDKCPEIAPTVRPAQIRIKSRAKTAKPTETALQPIKATAQQLGVTPDDTDNNIIALLLSAIINLISGIFNRISEVRTRSLLAKFPATVAMIALYIISVPIKILYAVATSTGSTGFSGGFTVLCMVYLISCTAVGLMG